jgi:hypothetical protein
MGELIYKSGFDEARDRLTAWWNGEDIGRPALQITVHRDTPAENVPFTAAPKGWVTDYSTSDFNYRVYLSRIRCINTIYLAEAMPTVAPDLAPNCLALYLGCKGVDQPGTVWCEPCIDSPENATYEFKRDNFYWDFSLRLAEEQLRMGKDKFMIQFPDLIEGLDTLAAMRGTEELLVDLIEHPEWVQTSLGHITDRYFDYYDIMYDMFKDDRGGSFFWAWAPGRMSKLQCDFSAMISPEMFGEFMVPVITAMTERLDYSMYHWDGPGAIPHHDLLLSIPKLNMLQWTPGAGVESTMHKRWWPLYHKTIDAGKKVLVGGNIEELKVLKREFGPKLKQFLINIGAKTLDEAEDIIRIASV